VGPIGGFPPRRALAAAVVGASLLATATLGLAGCGGGGHVVAGTVLDVNEADFQIRAPHTTAAGSIVLRVANHGPDQHELIVARAPTGRLGLRSDGVTVNEEALARAEVGSLEPARAGAVRDLEVHLAPGRYVLFCNMSGHYMGGMHSTLVVTR
jgi:uncharacterized cupredoxin-like copper-binding protein